MIPSRSRTALIWLAAAGILSSGCTVDLIPVNSQKVKSAKLAEQPLLRGPDAPGAFKHAWSFEQAREKMFDPTDVEFAAGGVRFKKREGAQGARERVAVFVTQTGPWFSALDSFKEIAGEGHQGFARYQLSPDSATWYYWGEKGWATAGPNYQQANSAQELQAHIGTFHQHVGEGTLVIKTFLVAPKGGESVQLKSVEVQGVSVHQDGWD